jgi:SAM-dependent methyltransferase
MTPREEFERYSRQRLYPLVTNPSWLVLRSRRRIFTNWLKDAPSGLRVLDIGGALQPYRPLLKEPVYTAIDLKSSPLVDQIGSADALPFADATFDLVLCTQVLEYVSDPSTVFAEVHRVLKPGGRFLASAPSFQVHDAGNDTWRFTPKMLAELSSGFSTSEVVAEIGTAATILRTANLWFAMRLPLKRLWRYSIFPLLNATGACFGTSKRPRLCANYSILTIKA